MAGVAQLVRAPGCGSGGRGFKSRRLPHFFVINNKDNIFKSKILKIIGVND